jgi:bifunctional UDP-N-acetylglucosamine pyrophosphorylase/glucosamine-1-phosphate N-acetyltransferase
MYAFDGALLDAALKQVTTDNAKGEEYLTDVVTILRDAGHRVGASLDRHWTGPLGVNDRVQLAEARRLLNDRILEAHMRAGVTIVDPASTWVDVQVTVEPDAVIKPGTQLHGATHIAAGAEVGPNCTLTGTTVGEDAVVVNAVCDQAEIGPQTSVGPFAYLRPGTKLARKAKAGTYVEMKNAVVGEGTKVPHLTYVGDAEIGEGSNIGAACVFVNYDGVEKRKSVVGDHVKVGSDNMLVAPVTIGDGAYTAAGSVITGDVPPGAMAVARARQRNIEGWVERKRPGTPSAEASRRAVQRNKETDA